MELIGKLIKILPEQNGQTERGPWVRGGFVIEFQDGEYPRNAAFTLFGENRINMVKSISLGSMVRVQFSVNSREYQERWYTDLSCYRVEPQMQAAYPQQQAPVYGQPYQQTPYPQQPVYQQPQQPVYQPQQPMAQPAQQQPVYPEQQMQGGTFDSTQSFEQENDLPF